MRRKNYSQIGNNAMPASEMRITKLKRTTSLGSCTARNIAESFQKLEPRQAPTSPELDAIATEIFREGFHFFTGIHSSLRNYLLPCSTRHSQSWATCFLYQHPKRCHIQPFQCTSHAMLQQCRQLRRPVVVPTNSIHSTPFR